MKCTIRIMLKYLHELFIWEKFCIADRSSHRISSVEKKTVHEHVRNVFIRWRSIHVRYISHDSSFRKGKRIRSESTAFNHRCSGNVIFRAWIVGGDQLFGLIKNNSSHCNKLFFLSQIIENGKESHTVSDNFERMTIEQLQKWYDNSGVNTSTAKVKKRNNYYYPNNYSKRINLKSSPWNDFCTI